HRYRRRWVLPHPVSAAAAGELVRRRPHPAHRTPHPQTTVDPPARRTRPVVRGQPAPARGGPPMNTPPASTETVAAARLLLTQMGISPADLVTVGATVPTFAEIVPRVRETLKAGTKRTYGTHLDRLERQWPD